VAVGLDWLRRKDTPPIDATVLQWLMAQGPVVALFAWAIWVLGRKLDDWNGNITQLTIAVNSLTAMVQAHMPSGR
jgi:hypothetical protein